VEEGRAGEQVGLRRNERGRRRLSFGYLGLSSGTHLFTDESKQIALRLGLQPFRFLLRQIELAHPNPLEKAMRKMKSRSPATTR
jgi:hypothetical protein